MKKVSFTVSRADIVGQTLPQTAWGAQRVMRDYRRLTHLQRLPTLLAYKMQESGGVALPRSEPHTSKDCSRCRDRRARSSSRTFCCAACGMTTDRDACNSTINIANRSWQLTHNLLVALGLELPALLARAPLQPVQQAPIGA